MEKEKQIELLKARIAESKSKVIAKAIKKKCRHVPIVSAAGNIYCALCGKKFAIGDEIK